MVLLALFGSFIIIGLFVTLWMYMYYCSEHDISFFSNPHYKDRITDLEIKVSNLKSEMERLNDR